MGSDMLIEAISLIHSVKFSLRYSIFILFSSSLLILHSICLFWFVQYFKCSNLSNTWIFPLWILWYLTDLWTWDWKFCNWYSGQSFFFFFLFALPNYHKNMIIWVSKIIILYHGWSWTCRWSCHSLFLKLLKDAQSISLLMHISPVIPAVSGDCIIL